MLLSCLDQRAEGFRSCGMLASLWFSGGDMGTVEAVAAAVREIGAGLRTLNFRGRSPNFERAGADGSLDLVNLQRVSAGMTGRVPGFTLNLNVVHGAVLRAWRATGYWMMSRPIRAAENVGVGERLGMLAFGYDRWWHPSDAKGATAVAREVLSLMETHGLPWLTRMNDPDTAIAALLPMDNLVWKLEVAAALLVERPGDPRRAVALQALRRWERRLDPSERPLCEWLVANLA